MTRRVKRSPRRVHGVNGEQRRQRAKHSELKLATHQQIRDVARKIVEGLNPEKVILFGSYAYGKPTIDSDVDMLIVMESNERPAARSVRAYRVVQGKSFPMDILVRTPRELAYRLEIGDCFFKEIAQRGKVLYARRAISRVD